MSLYRTTVRLLRLHRSLGLLLAAVLVVITVTGLLLNHTSGLELQETKLNSRFLMKWYGIDSQKPPQPVTGYRLRPKQWLSLGEHNQLFLNQQAVGDCAAPLHGAIAYRELLVVLCQDELVLLNREGELIEVIRSGLGLPANSSKLGVADDRLIVAVSEDREATDALVHWAFDIDTLQTRRYNEGSVNWSQAIVVPDKIAQLLASSQDPSISLETLILDIHTGRILGTYGVWLMDLVTVLLILLAVSGCWAWVNHKKLINESYEQDRRNRE